MILYLKTPRKRMIFDQFRSSKIEKFFLGFFLFHFYLLFSASLCPNFFLKNLPQHVSLVIFNTLNLHPALSHPRENILFIAVHPMMSLVFLFGFESTLTMIFIYFFSPIFPTLLSNCFLSLNSSTANVNPKCWQKISAR